MTCYDRITNHKNNNNLLALVEELQDPIFFFKRLRHLKYSIRSGEKMYARTTIS